MLPSAMPVVAEAPPPAYHEIIANGHRYHVNSSSDDGGGAGFNYTSYMTNHHTGPIARPREKKQVIVDVTRFAAAAHESFRSFDIAQHEKRMKKGFELLRAQEGAIRYHAQELKEEVAMATDLANQYLTAVSTSDEGTQSADTEEHPGQHICNRSMLHHISHRFLLSYLEHRDKVIESTPSAVSLPWREVESATLANAAESMKLVDNPQHPTALQQSTAYVLGYLEVVCRMPEYLMTKQGRVFFRSTGVYLQKHPFGRYFLTMVIAVKIILNHVATNKFPRVSVMHLAQDLVCLVTQTWQDRSANYVDI